MAGSRRCKSVKAIWKSFVQMIRTVREDFMLYMALSFAVFLGALFKFGIPALDGVLLNIFRREAILMSHAEKFDIIFCSLAPFVYTYVAGMVGLEDIDNHTANALFITPLGNRGYVISHFAFPATLGVLTTWLLYPIFHISALSVQNVLFVSVIWGIIGYVMALLMVTASRNKMEGLVITRVEAVSMLGYLVPFFMRNKIQYLFAWLPSWWIGKSIVSGSPVIYVLCICVVCLWAGVLYCRFKKRILT